MPRRRKPEAVDFVRAVYAETEPRPTEAMSGAELYAFVCEALEQDEVDVPMLPLDFYLDALRGDDPDRVLTAAMAASLNYLGLTDMKLQVKPDRTLDFLYHTFAALRIRLDCRFGELKGEPSDLRIKIN